MRTSRRPLSPVVFRYSPLVAALALALSPQHAHAVTFTVDTTLDQIVDPILGVITAPGSLRAAIEAANALSGAGGCGVTNNVVFAGAAPFVISPSSPLPGLQCSGLMVNGAVGGGKAHLDGGNGAHSFGFPGCGLVAFSRTKISNLEVSGYRNTFGYGGGPGTGLCGLLNVQNVDVHDNDTGVHPWDTSSVSGSTIVSNSTGIFVSYGGNSITGNFVGTDGASSLGNGLGIWVNGSSAVATISGNNVISGNSTGIEVNNSSGTTISGNKIGTNATGFTGIGNSNGIVARCGSNITVKDNVISANGNNGIVFSGIQGGGRVTISGNLIGVAGNGVTPLGNSAYGIILQSEDCAPSTSDRHRIQDNTVAHNMSGIGIYGGSNNEISGGNTITANDSFGVTITAGSGPGLGNTIVDNSIYGNGTKNIDLDYCCSTLPNNTGPGGPNNRQNYPVITSLFRDTANNLTRVSYTFESAPAGIYRIDVFSNDSSSLPSGQRLQNTKYQAAGSGPVTGFVDVPGLTAINFSLTATISANGTSEFSPLFSPLPAVNASPQTLNFGIVPVGQTSAPKSITIKSTGGSDYIIDSLAADTCYGGDICYGGPFTCTATCEEGAAYRPGTSCTITATFAPQFVGTFGTHIALCDNTATSPMILNLTGKSVPPELVAITPNFYSFGSVTVGARSATHTFVVSNPGPLFAQLGEVSTSGEFAIASNSCGSTMGPGQDCEVKVAFVPEEAGVLSGTLDVSATAFVGEDAASKGDRNQLGEIIGKGPSSSARSNLSGMGVLAAQLQLPDQIDLGAYNLGDPPLTQLVTLTNIGAVPVTFTNISVSDGPFTLGNGCTTLEPGASCTLTLGFLTSTAGDFTGTLNVVSSAVGGSRGIPLTAHAGILPGPHIRVSPVVIGFGDRMLGSPSAGQRVTITNVGNTLANMGTIAPSIDFMVTGTTCGMTLAPQATCFADVAFRPVGLGMRDGVLLVNSDAEGSPNVVHLAGTGCRPFNAGNRERSRDNCAP